jgi:PAS domain S-box-containing protein
VFSPLFVLLLLGGYTISLFLLATWAEHRSEVGRSVTDNPWVYALSLAAYCTSWTFYGSVGKAVGSGMVFLTIYLGPTLCAALWWIILRKLVRLKSSFHISSIADLLSARYGKSHLIAALATVMAFFGSVPYVALQLKSVISTFSLVAGSQSALVTLVGPLVVAFMILSTILLGVRRMDPTDRHPGMIATVTAQAVIKLVALVGVGLFAVYGLHGGWENLLASLPADHQQALFSLNGAPWGGQFSPYVVWASYLILAMSAILFLPHQFHLAVVENSDERHILTASWAFPLYLLVINAFVVPIAAAGIAAGLDPARGDIYVLGLPALHKNAALALLVFFGGFSAAMGMVMVSSMTNAVMLTNHLLLPVIEKIPALSVLKRRLLQCRWGCVAFLILVSYWFELAVGESYILVNIGIIAFGAVLQFAPAILGGIFWRGGTRAGALAGLSAGFVLWLHTMLLPALAKSGSIGSGLVRDGLFGLSFLRSENLFGLTGLDSVTHSVFWTLTMNVGLYVLVSLFTRQSRAEFAVLSEFTGQPDARGPGAGPQLEADIDLAEKCRLMEQTVTEYMPQAEGRGLIQACLRALTIEGHAKVSVTTLTALYLEVEKAFSGVVGAAAAHKALARAGVFTHEETKLLGDVYGSMLAEMRITPDEMARRIDYLAERERLLTLHAEELKETIRLREQEIVERKRVEAELRESETRIRALFDATSDSAILMDTEGVILAINEHGARRRGLSPEDMIGHLIYDHLPPNAAEIRRFETREAVRTASPRTFEEERAGACYSITIYPILDAQGLSRQLASFSRDITAQREFEGTIRRLNEGLELRVHERTQQLESANQELKETLEQLKRTHKQLVESEKMASLGGLVAGVAHEINTPVGIGVTAASHLELKTKAMLEEYKAGALKRASLEAYLGVCDESTRMILSNLRRASDLIRSFKQVAVDRTTEERRLFRLRDYLEEVLLSLRPQLKKTAITVELFCDPELAIHSYPGTFSQILTNLVMNSLQHAYDPGQKGRITLTCSIESGRLRFLYADDGKGITPENLDKIFEPFYTTKRGRGGTGLGLHILYNLVTQRLEGSVRCESTLDAGTTFILDVPLAESGAQ